jgi:hypothetical protein
MRHLAAASLLVLSAPVLRAQEPTREPLPAPAKRDFHPSLVIGVRLLAREHVRIAELGIRLEKGDVSVEQLLRDEVLRGVSEEDRAELRAVPPDPTLSAEMLLCWKGFEALESVRSDAKKRGRPLRTSDLLEVAWSDRLRELPTEQDAPEVLAFLKEAEALAGRPVPARLWWPTVGYMLFAALNTPSWWPDDEAKRERERVELIQDLLSVAASARDAEAVRCVVDVALTPPLRLKSVRPGSTCARGRIAGLRAKVGFTRDHLDFVARFNQDQEAERRTGAPGSPWSANFKQLADFMAMMKLRILLELDPASIEKPGPLSCKYGTLEETRAYYQDLLARSGVDGFWVEARPDLERLLAGRLPHSLDPRIAELEEKLRDPTLGAEEATKARVALDELATTRRREQQQLAGFLTFQYGWLAPIELAVSELRRLDALATPEQHVEALANGWLALGRRSGVDWASPFVMLHLEGVQQSSEPGIWGAAMALRERAADPTCARALLELAARGTPRERQAAMNDAGRLPEELARGMLDITLNDLDELLRRNPKVLACRLSDDDELYTSLLRSTIRILRDRAKDDWSTRTLIETFDRHGVNLWSGGSPFSPDLPYGNREVLEWVASTLPDAEFERLEKAGRIPAELKRVREEMKGGR